MKDPLGGVRAALAAASRAGELGAWITPPDPASVLAAAADAIDRDGPAGPLLAKVLVHATDRSAAVSALGAARRLWKSALPVSASQHFFPHAVEAGGAA